MKEDDDGVLEGAGEDVDGAIGESTRSLLPRPPAKLRCFSIEWQVQRR